MNFGTVIAITLHGLTHSTYDYPHFIDETAEALERLSDLVKSPSQ